MSDCSTNANGPYDVARLRIEFEGEEIPWTYPLVLNGRVIKGLFVDGECYEQVNYCEFEWRGCGDGTGGWYCTACDEYVDDEEPYALFCPNCGARVRGVGDD